MRIKSLRLQNFRQFRGTTNLKFSCDPKKNVTVILGDNTFGKTTLLQAFHWVFYGKLNSENQSEYLLNFDRAFELANGERENVEVEITVTHGEFEYIITRTQQYLCLNNYPIAQPVKTKSGDKLFSKVKISYKDKDGQTKAVRESDIAEVINGILPEDLAGYFFFDTERVNSISTRKDVTQAVKGLLGLAIIDNAIKHPGDRAKKTTVIGKFFSKMNVKKDSNAQKLLKKCKNWTKSELKLPRILRTAKYKFQNMKPVAKSLSRF